MVAFCVRLLVRHYGIGDTGLRSALRLSAGYICDAPIWFEFRCLSWPMAWRCWQLEPALFGDSAATIDAAATTLAQAAALTPAAGVNDSMYALPVPLLHPR